ncbi:hypothetical protein C8R45DRAFT_1171231 [Mycena sanguinolenta]|nr:hypothetical protein C8R45DRAFT_1171231 [Mycena sanguinolenta]
MSTAQEPLPEIETLQRQVTAARGHLARERQHVQEVQEAFKELLEAYNGLGENHEELHGAFNRLAALYEGLLAAYNQLQIEHRDLQRLHERLRTLFLNNLRNLAPPATPATETSIAALASSLAASVSTNTAAAASMVAAASTSGTAVVNTSLNNIMTDSVGALVVVQPLWTGSVGDVPDSHAVHPTTAGVVACKRCGSQVKSGKGKKKNVVHAFRTPPQNATKEELHQTTAGRKSKAAIDNPNPLNYLSVIIPLGKKFGIMEELWLARAAFAVYPEDGPPPKNSAEELDAMFKSGPSYLRYLTTVLYDHVPSTYHGLIPKGACPDFENDMSPLFINCRHSTAINTLKINIKNILAIYEIANNRETLLYHRGEDCSRPPSAYPPIFYKDLKKDAKTLLLNPVGPMSLRCILFGSGSIKKNGTAKPLSTTLGYQWKLEGLTIGSICATLVFLIHVINGVEESFDEKGKISKIDFQATFRAYKLRLMKYADTRGVRNILRFWTKIVFVGVETVSIHEADERSDNEADAEFEAEFAAAMEGLDLEGSMDNNENIDDAMSELSELTPNRTPEPAISDAEDEAPLVPVAGPGARGATRTRASAGPRARGRGRGRGCGSDAVEEPVDAVEELAATAVVPRQIRTNHKDHML